ncbi:UdgX family uracil-DNA binding protein [Burkholderia sp. A1]|uniref:UdgX family uracil-DNA binding protein n=1 Tax=Burkholderia sp. A1 TaxID=148446 RepID=UPI00046AF9FB|nr:UdgX family uracil-DNA binding protein [Burkholderia sp. A1]
MELTDAIPAPARDDAASHADAPPAAPGTCRRCPLWADATQAVDGRGPVPAALMLVGDQPSDHDDRHGAPFSGTSGRILERALRELSLTSDKVYLTHAVKHFKWEARGRQRLHRTPAPDEVAACRYWLDHEIEAVKPRVIVALGTLAWRTLLGDPLAGLPATALTVRLPGGSRIVAAPHPALVMRTRDADSRERVYGRLVDALRIAKRLVEVDADQR